jgi:hypothetical protein
VLCYIFSRVDALSGEKLVRVRQWFWRASFSERYRVGGGSFVSKDLEQIHKFIIDETGDAATIGEVLNERRLKSSVFRSNNSRTRAFTLALALRKPRNITNGAFIDTTEALSIFNKKQFHHIYPRAYLKRINDPDEHNSIVNICMLAASENNAIRDSNPNKYLIDCINSLGDQAEEVLSSNLLPTPNKFNYSSAGYSEFLEERVKLVAEYVRDLCEGVFIRGNK